MRDTMQERRYTCVGAIRLVSESQAVREDIFLMHSQSIACIKACSRDDLLAPESYIHTQLGNFDCTWPVRHMCSTSGSGPWILADCVFSIRMTNRSASWLYRTTQSLIVGNWFMPPQAPQLSADCDPTLPHDPAQLVREPSSYKLPPGPTQYC